MSLAYRARRVGQIAAACILAYSLGRGCQKVAYTQTIDVQNGERTSYLEPITQENLVIGDNQDTTHAWVMKSGGSIDDYITQERTGFREASSTHLRQTWEDQRRTRHHLHSSRSQGAI